MWSVLIIIPAVTLALRLDPNQGCVSVHNREQYICKPFYECDSPRTDLYRLDSRLISTGCPSNRDVCCKVSPNENNHERRSVEKEIESTTNKSIRNKPCGIRKQSTNDINGNVNIAGFAEFPWMVEVLKANHSAESHTTLAISGGVLIAPNVILTTAHGLLYKTKYQPSDIKVRAGEWDTQHSDEKLPHQERQVEKIIIHNEYNRKTLFNDIALLILSDPFEDADNIGTICLPPQDFTFVSNSCIATGWDKDRFGKIGDWSVPLKKSPLAIVPHSDCQTSLRQTRLGNRFNLHDTFICAQDVADKDLCANEAALVCPEPGNPDRYLQAGIIGWRLGCLQIPAVYINVAKFRNWIDEQMKTLSIDTSSYTD